MLTGSPFLFYYVWFPKDGAFGCGILEHLTIFVLVRHSDGEDSPVLVLMYANTPRLRLHDLQNRQLRVGLLGASLPPRATSGWEWEILTKEAAQRMLGEEHFLYKL
ncbi:hypothetical protein E2C01_035689 [Portunus trituberculatus]|uniref:Uncharacterized protein n=1 Tax=Portunus trituberculatus TaxID=210409 RepID=A0A5B7F914_PORTR|nr:hypothetical protein [Portunus trituberculatus]